MCSTHGINEKVMQSFFGIPFGRRRRSEKKLEMNVMVKAAEGIELYQNRPTGEIMRIR
jgi:hypothetical protein